MPAISGLLSKGKGALGWARGKAGSAMSWYGGLGNTAKFGIAGAATGALSGAFGVNPFNTLPFFGDVDAGGALGGAVAGGLAGMAFGRFGAGRGLMGKGRGAIQNRAMGMALYKNGTIRGGLMGRTAGRVHNFAANPRVAMFTNKYGDQVLNAMGAGAAGLIGGSILSTNSPY